MNLNLFDSLHILFLRTHICHAHHFFFLGNHPYYSDTNLYLSAFAFVFSLLVFGILKATIGVRVEEEEEVVEVEHYIMHKVTPQDLDPQELQYMRFPNR